MCAKDVIDSWLLNAVPVENRRRYLGLLIWAAYFILPNDAAGLVRGVPLGPIEAAALLAIGWLALNRRRLPFAPVAALMMIVTTAAGLAIPGTNGFRARYFVSADGSGAPERSPEFVDRAFTRIDRQLDFVPGANELPLNFFNDNSRYSLFQVVAQGQGGKPVFSVRWSGVWRVPDGVEAIYVAAPQAIGEVSVDGAKVAAVGASDAGDAVANISLARGWHRLDVALSSPAGAPKRFSAGTIHDGVRTPFDSREVVTQQIREWQMSAAGWLRIGRTLVDAAALLLVAVVFATTLGKKVAALFTTASDRERRDQVMVLFAAAAAIDAWRFAWPWATRVMRLVPGDDTLTYETYARDILFNGILMSGGKPLGQGEPFYYQAFYPYFLAGTHWLFGEFLYGAVLVQRLLAAYAIVTLARIAIRFTADRAWVVALPIATAFIGWKFWPIADQPLNESLYVPLLVAATAALIRLCNYPSARRALSSGILSGVAAITRSTALVAWVVVWPAIWLALRGRPGRARVVAILIASFLVVFSLVAVRNWIVAGVFAPTSTEMGITLLGGNEPPAGLTIDPARRPYYQRFGLSDHTATVIDYAIAEPRLFSLNIGRKALFVLGFYEPYAPGWGYSPVYIATWITASAGLWLALRHRRGSIWPVLIPAIVSLTQFVAIVMVYPKGERLVVPVHVVLIPYCAAAVWFAVNSRSSEAANVNLIASRTNT